MNKQNMGIYPDKTFLEKDTWSSHHGSVVNESDQEPEVAGSIPDLAQRQVKDPVVR